MTVRMIHAAPKLAQPEVVKLLELALEEARVGKFTGILIVGDGPEHTNFSYHTESEKQADSLMGFYERVVKPVMQETYTFDGGAA